MWDVNSEEVYFGIQMHVNHKFQKHEQVFISYGECSNSVLLTDYGFCLPRNRYDYFRVNGVTLEAFKVTEQAEFRANLEALNLKPELRADLKINCVHRDVLKLLRANLASESLENECIILAQYKKWLSGLLDSYATSHEQDSSELCSGVASESHWMYEHVLTYRTE